MFSAVDEIPLFRAAIVAFFVVIEIGFASGAVTAIAP